VSARRVAALLIAALAVISLAIWLSSRRPRERDMAVGDLVLPGLQQSVNAVTTVTLRKGDDTGTTLKKGAADWSVGERGWPADVSKVRKLLLDLGALNIVEEKTRLAANYPALGVEDVSSPKATGTLVDVAAPVRSWTLIIGKSSSAKAGFVRVAGAPQSLLAAPLLSVDADPKGWLDRALLDIPLERVREVAEKPAQGPAYVASREKKEQSNFTVGPLPKRRALTGPAAAEPLAASLASLALDDVRKVTSAGDAAPAHAVFSTFDGLQLELSGRKDGTHDLVLISARSSAKESATEADKLNARLNGWEFEIPDYKYSAIFTPLEELLQKPPEPAKKGGAAAHKTATAHPAAVSPPTSR
jgi:Domain of unknown function (DUF4340)